jgi:cytochrome c peroxidase
LSAFGFFFGLPVLFWDGREQDLASLISKPIANHIEMGMDNETQLLEKLNALPYLQTLVEKAYGENQKLTMERLASSMALFLSAISTSNSKFDKGAVAGNSALLMNALETKGKQLFQTTYQCNNCHNPSPGGYTSDGFVNIGLDLNPSDKGRMNISNNTADLGAFKVPDLHNVTLTAPYMHDGRFKTLDEVLEHYSHGIQESDHLDSRLRNQDGSAKKFNITAEDKVALMAFLNTLSDYSVLTNPLLSSPFKYR